MTNFCDERKMDRLINLVQAPVVISIVIVVVVLFSCVSAACEVMRAVDVTIMQVLDFSNVVSGSECNCDSLSMKMMSEIGTLQCYAIS